MVKSDFTYKRDYREDQSLAANCYLNETQDICSLTDHFHDPLTYF